MRWHSRPSPDPNPNPNQELHTVDWLDPPEPAALRQAVRELFLLGALDRDGGLAPLGAAMARLPIY